MSRRKKNDPRRLDFCLRCLRPSAQNGPLVEHHTRGRRTRPGEVVFICPDCHSLVEDESGPIPAESMSLDDKKRLLLSSSSLLYVVGNRERILSGFVDRNRKGPDLLFGRGFMGHLGAVGYSGKKYYFVAPDSMDGLVFEPSDPAPREDGIGDPAGGSAWVRFQGHEGNILSAFIDAHASRGSPGGDLSALAQD
ncbi:MAG: hypothetical protein O7H41_16470 [Planctomycetota bacterium]|nr:hypothetical protein [Planctomycetota bacterium]